MNEWINDYMWEIKPDKETNLLADVTNNIIKDFDLSLLS